jgi:putative restriction endonuclease
MAKVVLTVKAESNYDDMRETRYHFPEKYLKYISAAVGDWGVYYEPRRTGVLDSSRGGRQSYIAIVRIDRVYADSNRTGHYYADLSNYLEFTQGVPFKLESKFFESALEGAGVTGNSGWFRFAARPIPDQEFDAIWETGFAHVIGKEPRIRSGTDIPEEPPPPLHGFEDQRENFIDDAPDSRDLRIVTQLVSRTFRDRAFSAAVKNAYADTCAMSGLKLINGGGRSEVQAAHIKPVSAHGPDSIRNGIALSGTFHWLFDKGLISIDDDFSLLVARERTPDTVQRLLAGRTKLWVPSNKGFQPHQKFLAYHRSEIFKG